MQPSLQASFTESGTLAAPDLVRLRSMSRTGDTVVVEVALGGPTTSGDLYSFAFDLVLGTPSVVEYVVGSVALGNALTFGSGQSGSVQASLVGDHVVVGVSKLGGGPGNRVTVSEAVLVQLAFRVLEVGTSSLTFATAPRPPAALDSTGAVLSSVRFDSAAASISAQ